MCALKPFTLVCLQLFAKLCSSEVPRHLVHKFGAGWTPGDIGMNAPCWKATLIKLCIN